MEVLVAIAIIIYAVVKNARKKAEQQAKQTQTQSVENRPVRPTGDFFEKGESGKGSQDKGFEGVLRPNAEAYRRQADPSHIGKKLVKNDFSRPEYVSLEGTAGTEGECIEEDPKHCAVEHFEDSVYTTEISDSTVGFSRDDLVRGVVMAEILSKPKCME